MTVQRGRDLLLKVSDGGAPPNFTTVAGLRARTIALNARVIDASDSDSAGWRDLLAHSSQRSVTVNGSGIFRDAASDARVRALFFDQESTNWQACIPDFGILEGPFLVTSLEYTGRHDGEAQFTLALASAGAVSFQAT